MQTTKIAAAVAVLFLASGVPVWAGDSSASATSATAIATSTAPLDEPDLNAIVCRSMPPPTGTRIGGRRVCHTEKEWEDIQHRAADNLTKMQVQIGTKPAD